MNRTALKELAELRIREAEALLAAGLWDGAYYLTGYAVECALKACIMRYVELTGAIFRDKRFSENCFTHKPWELAVQADLKSTLETELKADATFAVFWKTVTGWTEEARYSRHSEAKARELLEAVTNPTSGVLPWIKQHW